MRSTFALSALLTLAACGNDPVDPTPYDVQPLFSDIQDKVLTPSCTGGACHDADEPQAELDLTAGTAYQALISGQSAAGQPYVVPGDPADSFLVEKLRGDIDPSEGLPMPMGTDPLDEAVIQAIEQWIIDGAENN